MSDVDGVPGPGKSPVNGPLSPSQAAGGPLSGQPGTPQSQSQQPPPSQGPSVNNTYVNANLSIQQLNIQSVNQPGPGSNPSMQIQQMTNEMNLPPGANGPVSTSMSQQQTQMMFNGPQGPGGPQGPPQGPMDPMAQAKMDPMAGYGPGPGMQPRGFATGPPTSGPSPGIPSPNYRGNANVQVQAKAPNTIQYLPANPPSSQPGGMPPGRKDFPGGPGDMFSSPLTHMDKMQPNAKGMMMSPGPHDMMGPGGMGPGGPMDPMGRPMGGPGGPMGGPGGPQMGMGPGM